MHARQVLVENQNINEQKMLGGYDKKINQHRVMNDKEVKIYLIQSILKAHAEFLSSTPPAVFEKDLEDPLLNPILLEELQRQLDGV